MSVVDDLMSVTAMVERLGLTASDCISVGIECGQPKIHLTTSAFDAAANRFSAVRVTDRGGVTMSIEHFVHDSLRFVCVRWKDEAASQEPADTEKEAVPPVPEASEI